MPASSRRRALAWLPLALALPALAPTALAAPAPRQSATVRFTSSKPGAPAGVEWSLHYRNPGDPAGKPYAVQTTVVDFPPGTRFDFTAPVQCKASDAELTLNGPGACPAGSRVGTGKLDVDTGSASDAVFPRILHNDVTNFNNAGESIIFTQSTNMPGAQSRTVTRAKVHGTTITTEVPPLPGVPPPDPFTALKLFRLSVAPVTRAGASYVTTPATCPPSGKWVVTLAFVYRDGVRQVVTSPSPCVPPRPRPRPRLLLTVSPRRTAAERATAFHFEVMRPGGAAVGAIVSLGGHSARTGPRGRATLVVRFAHTGRHFARATLPGFTAAGRWIRCEADDD